MSMMDKVVDTIKEGMGELEVEAINRLVQDSQDLVTAKAELEAKVKELDSAIGEIKGLNDVLSKNKIKVDDLNRKLFEREEQIAKYKEREVEFRVAERMQSVHIGHTDRVFDILDNSLRQYTQKTTRNVVIGGGEFPVTDHMGKTTMQKSADMTVPVVDTTEQE